MALPALDPSMSRADILSARRIVSDYDIDKSVDKAKLYILATRWLLESPVSRVISVSQGEEADIDTKIMQSELDKAVEWLRINEPSLSGTGSKQRYADFRCFREI